MNSTALYLIASAAVLAASALFGLLLRMRKRKSVKLLTPFKAIAAGTLISAFLLFIPVYLQYFGTGGASVFKTLLLSLHNAIRLFVVDADFDIIRDAAAGIDSSWGTAFTSFAAVLYVLAPLLTSGFVLSFFKNASSYRKLLGKWFRSMYVFSSLNERSIALARSVRKNHRRALIVFTNASGGGKESNAELGDSAEDIGAVCFRKDIADINLHLHRRGSEVNFFIMEDSEPECMRKSMSVIRSHGAWPRSTMYVFSDSETSGIVVSNIIAPLEEKKKRAKPLRMRIRRVDPVRSMLYDNAYEKGAELYRNAKPDADGQRVVSALVVGCGRYGSEMIKLLTWLFQMDGCRVEITAVDSNPEAEKLFASRCPELMSPERNGKNEQGEARYTIRFVSGMDINSPGFVELVSGLTNTTYAFIALGTDDDNIRTAVSLRMLFERMNIKPIIQTPVFDRMLCGSLQNAHTYDGKTYDIDFFGDIETRYSEKVICGSDIEKAALERHKQYSGGKEDNFWAYEYNYRSSLASIIYGKTRRECGIPGADKKISERTPEERTALARMEHERWNAYMRSEGYVYSETRNNLAKTHPDLVNFSDLPADKWANDDIE